MHHTPHFAIVLGLLFTTGTATAQPAASERYYITIFGAQSVPFRARYTHTWATFARTVASPSGEQLVEVTTISWMPATLQIRPFAVRPEPGVNLSLADTFAWISSFNGRVSVWGPYEISAERYALALARKAELESGSVSYRATGTFTGNSKVSNCGQSFTQAAPLLSFGYQQPTPAPGINGTGRLAVRSSTSGEFINPEVTYNWLLSAIGANQYPTSHRQPGERVPYFRR
jgi:hypothetical protein